MSTSYTRLAVLFHRYYSGSATAQETDELMGLIHEANEDTELAALLKQAWEDETTAERVFSPEQSTHLLNAILKKQEEETAEIEEDIPVRHFSWIHYAAAAVLLLVGIGTYWTLTHSSQPALPAPVPVSTIPDISPGTNKAVLTLADGSTILLDQAAKGILTKQGTTNVAKTAEGQLVYQTKATGSTPQPMVLNTITTPFGGQFQITLPDGSRVWLNAASSIRFPTAFAQHERHVEVTGEVYFEVRKDAQKPFRVRFGEAEVEVLGTSFNIMAYKGEAVSQTTLVEGAVVLRTTHGTKRLVPGQQAAIQANNDQITVGSVDIDEVTAWKSGLFYFKDASIEAIMKQAARWYNIEVSFQGKIPVRQFTGKVSRNVNISELLTMLRYTGVNSRIDGRKIIIFD